MGYRSEGVLGESDPTEIRSDDDLAARHAEEFLAMALIEQQVRARGGAVIQRGVCISCSERCLPAAVYCDADCRDDHERRMAASVRNGGGA